MMEAELGATQPRAKEHRGPSEPLAGTSTTDTWNSGFGLQNRERIPLCCLSPSLCGDL